MAAFTGPALTTLLARPCTSSGARGSKPCKVLIIVKTYEILGDCPSPGRRCHGKLSRKAGGCIWPPSFISFLLAIPWSCSGVAIETKFLLSRIGSNALTNPEGLPQGPPWTLSRIWQELSQSLLLPLAFDLRMSLFCRCAWRCHSSVAHEYSIRSGRGWSAQKAI